MNRNRIWILITVVALLAGGAFAWFKLSALKAPVRNALEAVPETAFCLIGSQQAQATWDKLKRGNLIWEELQPLGWSRQAASVATLADSLLASSPELAELLDGNTCWLSLHTTGGDQIDVVFAVSLPAATDADAVEQLLRKAAGNTPLTESKHGAATLLQHPNWTAGWREGIVLLSSNAALLKSGFDQLDKGNSLLRSPGFVAVRQTASKSTAANVFVNLQRLSATLRRIAHERADERLDALAATGDWMEVDATLHPNLLLLNGYTAAADSAGHLLSAFRGQQPQRTEVQAVLPATTVLFVDYAFSNFDLYLQRYDKALQRNGLAPGRNDRLAALKTSHQFEPAETIGTWLGNEVCYALTPNTDGTHEPYALLSTGSTALALEALATEGETETSTDSSGATIRRLAANGVLPATFGPLFGSLNEVFYTVVQHYVVFARSPEALQRFAAANESGKTLARDASFTDFTANLGDEATLSVYAAGGRCEDLLRLYASDRFSEVLHSQTSVLSKFDGAMIRFSATDQELYFTSAALRHNPQSKQVVSSLWETALDTTVSSRPQLVANHNTKGLDVVVQDDAHTLYLISSTGKIFWKRNIGAAILGEVQQVDALKNGKLQLTFATENAIYVIDRNGNDLAPFPLKLPAKATSPLRVFDYDSDRNYRLLIACADKRVYNYTIKGERVEGWKFAPTANIVSVPAQHCVVGGKDYITLVDRGGQVYVVDRQGATRLTVRERLPAPLTHVTLETGRDLNQTRLVAADSLGNVVRVSLSGNLERLHLVDFAAPPAFLYADVNGDGSREYLFSQAQRLLVFDQDKKLVLSQTFETAITTRPQVFSFGSSDVRISVTCAGSGHLHLLHNSGTLSPGSPLTGNTACSIGQLNSTTAFTLVCGANGRYICAYPLP